MSIAVSHIHDLIVKQLSLREMRLLSLVVAIRKSFADGEGFKGDLNACVKSSLRRMIAGRTVLEVEGTFTLVPPPMSACI